MTLQNRIECQLRTPCEPRTGREWAHCVIRHTPNKPPELIAAATGIPLKRLIRISAPQGDAHPRLEEIAAITQATGRYDWLRFYVRAAGCELFPMPIVGPGGFDAEIFTQTADSLHTLSGVVDTLRAISVDRSISNEERTTFDDVVGRHMACVARLQAWVRAQSDQQAVQEAKRGAEVRRVLR